MHLRDAHTGEPCEILCPCTDCKHENCHGKYDRKGCSSYEPKPTEINESTGCGTFTTDQVRPKRKSKRKTKEDEKEDRWANQFMIGGDRK